MFLLKIDQKSSSSFLSFQEKSALHEAATGHQTNLEIIKILFKNGCKPDHKDFEVNRKRSSCNIVIPVTYKKAYIL